MIQMNYKNIPTYLALLSSLSKEENQKSLTEDEQLQANDDEYLRMRFLQIYQPIFLYCPAEIVTLLLDYDMSTIESLPEKVDAYNKRDTMEVLNLNGKPSYLISTIANIE